MPYAPGTRCSDPRCGNLATDHGRCDTHRRKPWTNPSQHTQLMNPSLERLWRKQVRAKTNGNCAHCGHPGAIADHIIPIAEGGALYDPDNGQYLCTTCDQAKTHTDLARMAIKRKQNKKTKTKN